MKKQKTELPPPEPPSDLSEKSQELWKKNVHRTKTSGRRALLHAALKQLDRADECAAAVNGTGLTITTQRSGVSHVNPLLAMEERFRRAFASAWLSLGMESQASSFCGEQTD